jgi:hypothetical protein
MKNIITLIIILSLFSCASTPIPRHKPFLVSGIPISMDDTTWYRDYCTHGQPVNNEVIPYGESCQEGTILHHSFSYRVRLRSPMNKDRQLFNESINFVLTGGKRIDYNSSNRDEEFFILQNSPIDLMENTGIKYIGTQVSYNKKANCIYHSRYIHTDYRNCPNRNFHEKNKDQCLSIDSRRIHYTE